MIAGRVAVGRFRCRTEEYDQFVDGTGECHVQHIELVDEAVAQHFGIGAGKRCVGQCPGCAQRQQRRHGAFGESGEAVGRIPPRRSSDMSGPPRQAGMCTHGNSSPLDLWMVITRMASSPGADAMHALWPVLSHHRRNEYMSACPRDEKSSTRSWNADRNTLSRWRTSSDSPARDARPGSRAMWRCRGVRVSCRRWRCREPCIGTRRWTERRMRRVRRCAGSRIRARCCGNRH